MTVGTVFNLRAPGSTCNCDVAIIIPGGTQQLTCRDVGEMYHAEDALQAIIMEPEMRKALDSATAKLIELTSNTAPNVVVTSPTAPATT